MQIATRRKPPSSSNCSKNYLRRYSIMSVDVLLQTIFWKKMKIQFLRHLAVFTTLLFVHFRLALLFSTFFRYRWCYLKFIAVLLCMCNITPGGRDTRETFSLLLSQFTITTFVVYQGEDFFLSDFDFEFQSLS